MNKESIDSIVNAIKPVAEKIGEGAAHLYEIYIRQMVAEGIGDLVSMAIFWITFAALCFALAKFAKKSEWDYGPDNTAAVVTVLIGLLGGVMLLVGMTWTFSSVTNDITKIANPEYHAVQRILDTVKGKE